MNWRRRHDLDLEDIAHFGIVTFGYAQAEAYQDGLIQQFELLAEHPRIGLELEEREGVLRFGYGFTRDLLYVRRGRVYRPPGTARADGCVVASIAAWFCTYKMHHLHVNRRSNATLDWTKNDLSILVN